MLETPRFCKWTRASPWWLVREKTLIRNWDGGKLRRRFWRPDKPRHHRINTCTSDTIMLAHGRRWNEPVTCTIPYVPCKLPAAPTVSRDQNALLSATLAFLAKRFGAWKAEEGTLAGASCAELHAVKSFHLPPEREATAALLSLTSLK